MTAEVGAYFTAAFSRDAPWLLAAAGAAGTVAVWDVLTNASVSNRYTASTSEGTQLDMISGMCAGPSIFIFGLRKELKVRQGNTHNNVNRRYQVGNASDSQESNI